MEASRSLKTMSSLDSLCPMGIAWAHLVLRLSVIHKKSTDASATNELVPLGLSLNCSEPHFMWEMAVVIISSFGNYAAKCI